MKGVRRAQTHPRSVHHREMWGALGEFRWPMPPDFPDYRTCTGIPSSTLSTWLSCSASLSVSASVSRSLSLSVSRFLYLSPSESLTKSLLYNCYFVWKMWAAKHMPACLARKFWRAWHSACFLLLELRGHLASVCLHLNFDSSVFRTFQIELRPPRTIFLILVKSISFTQITEYDFISLQNFYMKSV